MISRPGSPRTRMLAIDAGIAASCLALLVDREFLGLGADRDIAGSPVWTAPLLAVGPLALLWRRSRPILCASAVFLPYGVHAAITGQAVEGAFALVPGLVALYSLGAYAVGRARVAGIGIVVAGEAVHDSNDPAAFPTETSTWAYLFFTAVGAGVLLAGVVVAARRRSAAATAAVLEAEARQQQAVATERAKIARELHDVVTHNVNVVVLQAMAAIGVLDSEPARARGPLEAIESSGREALAEMRRMLGVLRDEAPQLEPQPNVHDVPRLAASLRAAGERVDCRMIGDVGRLPEGMGIVVFRIVQEALTNALKHARGAASVVEVRAEDTMVEVEVTCCGGTPSAGLAGAGQGLIGMRERATLFGGQVQAGPTAHGFRVLARLPVEERFE